MTMPPPPPDKFLELRDEPDLWRLIQPNLTNAVADAITSLRHFALDYDDYARSSIVSGLEEKFRTGEKEHGRSWLAPDYTRQQLLDEIRDEIRDLVIYHAMLETRWPSPDPDPDSYYAVAA